MRSRRLAYVVVLALGSLPALALGAAGGGGKAAKPTAPEALSHLDVRAGDRADLPSGVTTARRALDRSLGDEGKVETDAQTGNVTQVVRTDELLTARSAQVPGDVALNYVRSKPAVFGLDSDDFDSLRLAARDVSPDGVTHLRWQQASQGIGAFDSGVEAHVTRGGRLVSVSGSPEPDFKARSTEPQLSAAEALEVAREDSGAESTEPAAGSQQGAERSTTFSNGDHAELTLFTTADGVKLAWRLIVAGRNPFLYDYVVDATSGEVLYRQNLTADVADASVFKRYPGAAPGGGTTELVDLDQPTWLNDTAGSTRLKGNNAHAYSDVNNNNVADSTENTGTSGGGAWNYPQSTDFPGATPCAPAGCTWDSATPASEQTNRNQATTNLFYLVNNFHDYLLTAPIGFDEASGNFEQVNSGGQGFGSDAVQAENADSGGINNANFSTPPDGTAPRMQMYLWDSRDVNGSDDASIVYHEYGHGLSNRLVVSSSGGSTLFTGQARGMGEAWSDWYALDYLVSQGLQSDTAAVGDVFLGDYERGGAGIRRKPIDCRVTDTGACGTDGGFTYGDIATSVVPHGVGEVWAQTLWDIRRQFGEAVARQLVTGGMRLSPDAPDFLDMRDAIIAQDQALGGTRYAQLWSIFAARGMGFSAVSPAAGTTGVTESFDPPVGIGHVGTTISDGYATGGDNDGAFEPGESIVVQEELRNFEATPVGDARGTLTSSTPGVTVTPTSATWPVIPANGGRAVSSTGFRVSLPESLPCQGRIPLNLAVTSTVGNATIPITARTGGPEPLTGPSAQPNLSIPDNNSTGAQSTLTVPAGQGETIDDLNLRIGELRHSYIGDVKVTLSHNGGTPVTLIDRIGHPAGAFGNSASDLIQTNLDDEAQDPIESATAAPFTGKFRPNSPLTAFDGQSTEGTWTLTVSDLAAGGVGVLRDWGLSVPDPCLLNIPVATTGAATEVAARAATLGGTLDPKGRATRYRFAYGKTTAYGISSAEVTAGEGVGAVPVSTTVGGLEPSTTYHYRVEGVRDDGLWLGEDGTFTTPAELSPPGGGGNGGGGGGGRATAFVTFSGGPIIRLNRRLGFGFALTTLAQSSGTVAFQTASPVVASAARRQTRTRKKVVKLTTASFRSDAAGNVRVKANIRGSHRELFKRGDLRITATVTVGGATFRRTVTMRLPKKKTRRR